MAISSPNAFSSGHELGESPRKRESLPVKRGFRKMVGLAGLTALQAVQTIMARCARSSTPPLQAASCFRTPALAGWSSRTTHQQKKPPASRRFFIGRAGRIRTDDPFTPSEVRYQTALQPASKNGWAKKQEALELASTEKLDPPPTTLLPQAGRIAFAPLRPSSLQNPPPDFDSNHGRYNRPPRSNRRPQVRILIVFMVLPATNTKRSLQDRELQLASEARETNLTPKNQHNLRNQRFIPLTPLQPINA